MATAAAAADPLAALEVVLPAGQTLDGFLNARALMPFSQPAMDFIAALGRMLREDPGARRFPELVALGFWARSATISRLRDRFMGQYPGAVRLPRGLAFHIAPSNVDTIFVYSLLLSLLAGNRNLVRVSSRGGDQSGYLVQLLGRALADAAPEIRAAVAIVRYGHDKVVTDRLSAMAELRIVWGGDQTVNLVRQSPLAPLGAELVFPNRHSLALLSAAAWADSADKPGIARRFVNDALWFGQMACSSPRDIVWLGAGADVADASASFWAEVEQAAEAANLEWADAHAVTKLLAAHDLAVEAGARGRAIGILATGANRITVVRRPGLDTLGTASEVGNGFFAEYRAATLGEVLAHGAGNWQTIVSLGVPAEAWAEALAQARPSGIARIVPIGSALDFDAIWDGVDLLGAMTRLVTVSA
jgi:hypothetical protein